MATILVVDDHPTDREFLVTLLGYAGYRSLEAPGGAEALEVVRAERPDLVIVGLVMSAMDGYEFVRQLRTDPTVAHTHVIFWTAVYQQSEAWDLAQTCGVHHILIKPTEPEVVLRTVATTLASAAPFDQPFSSEKFRADHLHVLTDKLFTQVQALRCEVAKRKHTEERLQQANEALDLRVRERTAELERVNQELQADIAARVQADEARRESEERYRIITQALSDYAFCFRIDISGKIEVEWLTESFTTTTGYTFEELVTQPNPFSMYVHPDDLEQVSTIWKSDIDGTIIYEFRIYTKESDLRWLRSYIQKVWDKERRFVRIYGAAQDITAKRRAEEKFRGLLESAPDAMVIVNQHGEIVLANSRMQDLFGYTREELLGKSVEILVPERVRTNHSKHRVNYCTDPRVRPMGANRELYGLRKDGSEFPVEISLSPLATEEGRLISSAIRDITSRKRAEEALRASESKYRLLVEQAADGICIVDRHGHFIEVNPNMCDLLGYSRTELIRLTIEDIIPAEDLDLSPLRYDKRQIKGTILRSHRLRHKNGAFLSVEISARRLAEAYIQAIVRDITERKQLEAQLAMVRKLESIGQLAAGIAHEINTPLQYVGDNVQFLQDAYKECMLLLQKYECLLEATKNEVVSATLIEEVQATASTPYIQYLAKEIPKAIEQSQQGVEHVSKIVCALREFSHPGSEEKSAIDLNRAITTTSTISRNVWKYVADVVTDFDPNLPPVSGFPGELNQSILNLLVNAAHAIGEVVGDSGARKGTITISTKHEGDWATIRLHDTGSGIPEAIRSRIFDPFFTTKKVGKGTGQGLAIVHSVIVEKHGGTINLETEVGRGTTFILRLPLCSSSSLS